MLRTAIEFLAGELNQYIKRKDPINFSNKETAIISNLMNPDGALAFNSSGDDTDNHKIILTLVNLEEDRIADSQNYHSKKDLDSSMKVNPAKSINFFLLLSVFSDDYNTALRLLSYVISFFQSNRVFEKERHPHMNLKADAQKSWQQIDTLILNLHNLSFEQMNNLWSALGSKYMPSVVFKVRTVVFEDDEPKMEVPLIKEVIVIKQNP
jgi:hypothetical protein